MENDKIIAQLKISLLISKSICGTISNEEHILLENWLQKSPKNKILFKELSNEIRLSQKLNDYQKINVQNAKQKVLNKYHSKKSFIFNKKWFKYAAFFIGFIGLSYFALHINTIEPSLVINENDITLELESGDIKIMSKEGKIKIVDNKGVLQSEQNGDRLNYSNKNNINKLAYNTLNIPNGKKFELVLSDGTEIYLNSGSSIKYPVKFIKGQSRKVFLEGEAFFKVTPNKFDSFIVNSNNLNTKVYGTSFNITSYSEENNTKVVLVEGKVGVYKNDLQIKENSYLKPSQMATIGAEDTDIVITNVDTYLYTAWMENTIIFKSEEFQNLFKRLERHFNVQITNNYTGLNQEKFNGIFKEKDIDYILNVLKNNIAFDYKITDNKIIINQIKKSE